MGYTKTKKLLCHSLVLSMTVSMMAVAPDSSAASAKRFSAFSFHTAHAVDPLGRTYRNGRSPLPVR